MYKDKKTSRVLSMLFIVLFMLILVVGCGKKDNEVLVDEVSSPEVVDVNLKESLEESVEENAEEISALLEDYIGLWKLDKIKTIIYTEEEAISIYMEIDERSVSFFYEESLYHQSFEYKVYKGSDNSIEINEYSDETGVAKKLEYPYRLTFHMDDEQFSIDIQGISEAQTWATSFSANLVDRNSLDTESFFKELEKVEVDEYLYDLWIWDVTELKGPKLEFMTEPVVYEFGFQSESFTVNYYDTFGTIIGSSINDCKVYQGEKGYFVFLEDSTNFYVVEKVDDQSAYLHSFYPFPLFENSELDTLKNDISIEEEVQHILNLNGSENFTEKEIAFFNDAIKGDWKDTKSEDDMDISLFFAVYSFSTGLNKNFTEFRSPSFYKISEIDLDQQKVVIAYTNENKGNEFFSKGIPEDVSMTLKYNKKEDSLVIEDIESSSENEFLDSVIGTEFWRR